MLNDERISGGWQNNKKVNLTSLGEFLATINKR